MKILNKLVRLTPNSLTYRHGTAIVPSFAADEWPKRMFLQRLLRRLDVDCVIDVGANLGQYARELRLIGFNGLIISFEPTPGLHDRLAGLASSDPNWATMELALGRRAGVLPLKIMASQLFNSFHQPANDIEELAAANSVVETLDVQVESLNHVLPVMQENFGFKRPLLKMDTQGHDVDVFDGASEVLDRIVALQSEVSVMRLYEDTPHWTEAIARYEQGGYQLAGMFAVNPGEDELREMDCFMVQSSRLRSEAQP